MKSPDELAASLLDSADSHKRRSTQLKRVAGGLRTELSNAQSSGLTQSELDVLNKAAVLLESMAERYGRAASLRKSRQVKQDSLTEQCTAAMSDTFGALTAIEDKVAVIASIQSYQLRAGMVESLRDLDYYTSDALNSLAYSLAKTATYKPVSDVVSEAWAKFNEARPVLIERHRAIIASLASKAG